MRYYKLFNDNFKILQNHVRRNQLRNKVYWIRGVNGRSQAYKKAAEQSRTEYFYAVFAKSMVRDDFMFDYTVDRGLSKRHRIFHSRLNELDLEYGTFNINLYSKSLCLTTQDNNILDFGLSIEEDSYKVFPKSCKINSSLAVAYALAVITQAEAKKIFLTKKKFLLEIHYFLWGVEEFLRVAMKICLIHY